MTACWKQALPPPPAGGRPAWAAPGTRWSDPSRVNDCRSPCRYQTAADFPVHDKRRHRDEGQSRAWINAPVRIADCIEHLDGLLELLLCRETLSGINCFPSIIHQDAFICIERLEMANHARIPNRMMLIENIISPKEGISCLPLGRDKIYLITGPFGVYSTLASRKNNLLTSLYLQSS